MSDLENKIHEIELSLEKEKMKRIHLENKHYKLKKLYKDLIYKFHCLSQKQEEFEEVFNSYFQDDDDDDEIPPQDDDDEIEDDE